MSKLFLLSFSLLIVLSISAQAAKITEADFYTGEKPKEKDKAIEATIIETTLIDETPTHEEPKKQIFINRRMGKVLTHSEGKTAKATTTIGDVNAQQ